MAFIPVPNCCEVFVEHQFNGKPNVGWVLHYESDIVPWTPLLMSDLAAQLKAWWDVHMQPLVSTATILTRIRLRELTTQSGLILDYTAGLPLTGSRAGDAAPANVAFVLKKNSGFSGRSFRGRIYQMGFTESDMSTNFISSTLANDYVDAWTEALLLVGTEAEYGMVIASKYSGGAPRGTGVKTDVSNITYSDLIVDTRRDRLP